MSLNSSSIGRAPGGRKLIAVVYADMVGYSRLIGTDDIGTIERLRTLRSTLIDYAVAEHGGKIVQTGGDSLLIVFDSIDGAVRCAVLIQKQVPDYSRDQAPDRAIQFRIGINIGDAIAEGTDLHGDGVNIAARLQAECPPGGICVSRAVRDHVHDRLGLEFDELGALSLKNIRRPVEAFVMRLGVAERPTLALPDKPSLAVLPFQNMSVDPEQEYFADGMVEDITTALSRIGGLFVIARNSSFTYKGRGVDVRQVGRELGVRYVLEGSVRKAGNRVRITCQLINAETGAHVWANRLDSPLGDIFDLQDRVTESVAGAIEPTLRKLEIDRATNKPTCNLDAYDLYLRALHHTDRLTPADCEQALILLRRAIAIDPQFLLAKALIGLCVCRQYSMQFIPGDSPAIDEAVAFSRSALAATSNDPTLMSFAGQALAILVSDIDAGRLALDHALALNPNSALSLRISALIHNLNGDWEIARAELLQAIRLSPWDPAMPVIQHYLAQAAAGMGEFELSLELSRKVVTTFPGSRYGRAVLIYSLVNTGRLDEAKEVARQMLAKEPDYVIAVEQISGSLAEARVRYRSGLCAAMRAAGIPE